MRGLAFALEQCLALDFVDGSEELKSTGVFPVFNDAVQSVRVLRTLLERGRKAGRLA